MSDDTRDQPMSDELKIDVDQEKLSSWDEVSKEYAGEGEEDKKRPVFTDTTATPGDSDDDAEGNGHQSADGATGETLENEPDTQE